MFPRNSPDTTRRVTLTTVDLLPKTIHTHKYSDQGNYSLSIAKQYSRNIPHAIMLFVNTATRILNRTFYAANFIPTYSSRPVVYSRILHEKLALPHKSKNC